MSCASEVKQIQITGGAHIMGSKKKRQSKKKSQVNDNNDGKMVVTKQQQQGGQCNMTSGYQAPLQVSNAAPLSQAFEPPITAAMKAAAIPLAGPALPTAYTGGGSGSDGKQSHQTKVELRKPKAAKSVHLHSKKAEVSTKTHHPKKKTRKIMLGLVSLKKRQTKAKRIGEKVKEMPLDQLKKHLVEKGLIKTTSKAPESILRQIAADAQIVSGHGL
jgi:hypothetical protein